MNKVTVHGIIRSKFYSRCKVATLDFMKVFRFRKGTNQNVLPPFPNDSYGRPSSQHFQGTACNAFLFLIIVSIKFSMYISRFQAFEKSFYLHRLYPHYSKISPDFHISIIPYIHTLYPTSVNSTVLVVKMFLHTPNSFFRCRQ